jgi:DNA-binding transcriptional MerR regulator
MNSEIKDGLFTSTQVSTLLGMKVQTLREWQRKNYLRLPDTGGWQRYSIVEILTLSAMDHILDTGVTHEMAATIARRSAPILVEFMAKSENDPDILIPYLLVSATPNEEAVFEEIEDLTKVSETIIAQSALSKHYVTRLLIDFKAIYQATFESLQNHVIHDGPRMFWKAEDGLNP